MSMVDSAAPAIQQRRVIKRNGSFETFQKRKIEAAIRMAFAEVDPQTTPRELGPVLNKVLTRLPKGDVSIEAVQDAVEAALMDSGYTQVAKRYILFREERNKARAARRRVDRSLLPDYIHVAKYARHRREWRRRETRDESIARVESMHVDRYPALADEIRRVFDRVRAGEVVPSMRAMQFAGPAVLQNHARMYNCSWTLIDRPEVFGRIFLALLCGCGVGYSVQWQHVNQLPELKRIDQRKVRHFVVPDTIHGWAEAVDELIRAYMFGGYHVEFSYHLIRPEGAPLRVSGGSAPGHLPLRQTLERMRGLLDQAQGRRLRPIECHDLICHVADAVLSGGVRRSSLIALFSIDDGEMMVAKTGQWWQTHPWRANANNSAVLIRGLVRFEQFARVFEYAREFGEPGFYFTSNPDYGCNPCGEIGLNPVLWYHGDLDDPESVVVLDGPEPGAKRATGFAFCNLTEVNAAACDTPERLYQAVAAASFIGTLQADYTDLDALGKATPYIAKREALLGVSMTGMMDRPDVALDPAVQRHAAKVAVDTNRRVANMLGIRPAARVTTVKPSGTASLWLGCVGSGIHPHHDRRYFRRVTANRAEVPFQYFRRINPHMVEQKNDRDFCLVFPVEVPETAITLKNLSAVDFIEHVFSTYENWIVPGTVNTTVSPDLTHNVSCTVVVKENEWEVVRDLVWDNRHRVAAMSFLPDDGDKKYEFAPRESVSTPEDESRWNYLIEHSRPVDYTMLTEDEDDTALVREVACASGQCELG